jgi:NADH-ubiquinone oxidoreductase chain 3
MINLNLILSVIVVTLLVFVLFGLNIVLAPNKPDEAKLSIYECGFQTIPMQTRMPFQVHFFNVALLFLVFDLEILLLFPLAVCLLEIGTYGFSIAIIFFIILTIGFVLEIGSGAISLKKLNMSS